MKIVIALLALLGLFFCVAPAKAYWVDDVARAPQHHATYRGEHVYRIARVREGGMTCAQAIMIGKGCGCRAAAFFGIPLDRLGIYRGMNLKRADEWAGFLQVAPAPHTAAIWPGRHVAAVIAVDYVKRTFDTADGMRSIPIAGHRFVDPRQPRYGHG